jgi:NAD(P)-dependent dehydrogenase (short-subunit alcohol dehydrogenase family)
VEAAASTREDFDCVISINLRGVWSCMRSELRQMLEQGSGAIVNCSSIGGLVAGPKRGTYQASKHGVLGLTKSAALDYAARGIRINAVCPGMIHTPMMDRMMTTQADALNAMLQNVPIGRLGRPEEIASVVLWLCSSAASFMVGHALAVDGGYTIR